MKIDKDTQFILSEHTLFLYFDRIRIRTHASDAEDNRQPPAYWDFAPVCHVFITEFLSVYDLCSHIVSLVGPAECKTSKR